MSPKSYRSPRWILALALLSALFSFSAAWGEESREELLDERSVRMKTFDNLDGTKTLHMGLEPLHYQPEGSEVFEVIDLELIEEAGWRNETNSFAVRLPEMLGTGDVIELEGGAIRWRPGMLYARTLSGAEIALGEAAPTWGSRSGEMAHTVVYPDLYPGMDLQVESRRGSLNLTFRFNEWALWLAPEQIDSFYMEAELEVSSERLEALDQRAGAGEPYEEIPLYFGAGDDDWVIGLYGPSGIAGEHLDTHWDALFKEEGTDPTPAPDSWRSNTSEWLNTGRVRHFFRYLPDEGSTPEEPQEPTEPPVGVSTSAAALTASFRFVERDTLEKRRFLSAVYDPEMFNRFDPESAFAISARCLRSPDRPPCKFTYNYMAAGAGAERFYLTFVSFRPSRPLLDAFAADPNLKIKDIQLGTLNQYFRPPGVTGFSDDEVIAYSATPWIDEKSAIKILKVPTEFPHPYNQVNRSVAGGSIKTSTWSVFSGVNRARTIDGDGYSFGSLMDLPAGKSQRAATDFRQLLEKPYPITVLLDMPYSRTPCPACTAKHYDPAIQALNGDYQVGAGFYDLRLEILTETPVAVRNASVTATSVGNHNDRLYPGATRSWDLELDQYSGPTDVLELYETAWDSTYFESWFTDPANGTVLTDPTLTAVGDKVRVHLKWKRADPSRYGKTEKLLVGGSFRNGTTYAGTVEIPVMLQAPEGNPTLTQIYPVVDNDNSSPMGLVDVKIPSAGLLGAVAATAELRWVSGPTKKLTKGIHWQPWSWATPGNDSDLVVYPDQFQEGMYVFELTPCLIPDGLAAPAHCLSTAAQQISLEVRKPAGSPPTPPKPVIDFVSPWSLDSPSGGAVTISIFGQNVGGNTSGTTVNIPQVVTNATPVSGSTASRTNISASLSTAGVCGPRQIQLSTAGGSDVHLFNVTKAFQGSPNHFATEAEAGTRRGLKILAFTEASAGKAVGPDVADVKSDVTFKMQVPANSANYQLYVLYRTPAARTARANVTIKPVGATGTTIAAALPATSGQDFKLASLYDLRQPGPPSKFSLQAGQTYEVIISTRTGQDFPLLDMLVLSDGSLPPTLSELCR